MAAPVRAHIALVVSALVCVCGGLEWTSADMPNGTTLTRCKGDNVSFSWSFATAPGEAVMSVHWFFSKGETGRSLAAYIFGYFLPLPGNNRTLDFLPNAGFTLYNVTVSDFGLYSVRVNWNQRGSLSTSTQFASLSLPDVPVIAGDRLTATVVPQPMWIADTQLWHMAIECGNFANLGTPPASVLWQTPTMEIVESSLESNGFFYLVLGNPVKGGLYTCFLDKFSPTLGCTKGFPDPQTTSAHVQVDAGELRLLVLETRLEEASHHIRAQLKDKDAMVANLTSELEEQESGLSSVLDNQDQLISNLTSELEHQKELTESLTSELDEQKQLAEEQYGRIASVLDKQDQLISNLTSELQQQKQLAEGQESLISDLTSALEDQKLLVASMVSELITANFTSSLERQDELVGSLTSEIKRQDEIITTLTSALKRQEELVVKLTSKVEQHESLVANLTSRFENPEELQASLPSTAANRSCADVFKWTRSTGIYTLTAQGKNIRVLCEDGWTIIQRRIDGSENFYRRWRDYVFGFGGIGQFRGEFWLGLDSIYRLTSSLDHSLRIDMEDKDGKRAFAEYTEFNISSEADNYRLYVGGYFGTAGDSLRSHSGRQFSTHDRDHDIYGGGNCAVERQGAWWYQNCDESNLNGPYRTPGSLGENGVIWDSFGGGSLKTVTMKIRPQHF